MADKSPQNAFDEVQDSVPGTVHLVDLDHSMRAKHSAGHQDIVLVPAPSDDPDDPVCPTLLLV